MNYKTQRYSLWGLLLLASTLSVNAAPRSKAAMERAAKAILTQKAIGSSARTAPNRGQFKLLKANKAYSVYGYEKGGFAIITSDDLVPEVIGYSESTFSDGANSNFKWYLDAAERAVNAIVASGKPFKTTTPDPSLYSPSVAPLITCHWGQESPYNDLCPEGTTSGSGGWQGYGETGRCVTGCVATAMAQVMYYHKSPVRGQGTNSVRVKQADGSYNTVTVDFSQSVYDWDNMLDDYDRNYSYAEGQAVAKLMLDCGVASNMEYATDGSGTYTNLARDGMVNYFGYPATAQFLERDGYSESDWMNLIFNEISNSRPLLYGGVDMMNGGHEFVFCGYDTKGRVWVNWGWNGSDDGYYDVALLDPESFSFSAYQDMVIGIEGTPRAQLSDTVNVATPGELRSLIADSLVSKIGLLKVNGTINSTDMKLIRQMAGLDTLGEVSRGNLHTLDLSEATIVAGGEPYLKDNSLLLSTADNQMPERGFYGSRSLRTLLLPDNITTLGSGALSGLSALDSVSLPEGADKNYVVVNHQVLSKDSTILLAVLPHAGSRVEVDKKVRVVGAYAMAGMHGASELVFPETVDSLGSYAVANAVGLQAIRVNGKKVIPTGYQVFSGVNAKSVTLYVRAGLKDVFARSANWSAFDQVVEFGTTIRARSTRREYGEPNPRFGYRLYGDYVDGKPEISCEATETSPAGQYAIHLERGTITSEAVDFEDGTLTVYKAKANLRAANDTIEMGQQPEFTYTVDSLKNGETELTLLTEPLFTVVDAAGNTLIEFTEAGEFTIVPSGAESQNYEFNYFPATLYVTVPTGIVNVQGEGQQKVVYGVYTLSGNKVADKLSDLRSLPKGVYIVNGKKLVVK